MAIVDAGMLFAVCELKACKQKIYIIKYKFMCGVREIQRVNIKKKQKKIKILPPEETVNRAPSQFH